MKKVVFIVSLLFLTSCSFFGKKPEVGTDIDEGSGKLVQTQTGETSPIKDESTSTGTEEGSEYLKRIKTISDVDYEYITRNGCNLDTFVFKDEKIKQYLVGLTFTNVLILRSKVPNEFKCFKLEKTITGVNVGIIDDYGEETRIENITFNKKGFLEVPKQDGFDEFYKTRHFLALEHDLGMVFEGFFYPRQLKKVKIKTLGIAVFRKPDGTLAGYEYTAEGKTVSSSAADKLVSCITNSKVLTEILSNESTLLEGIFRELEGRINVKGTVMESPRYYHSFIEYYYKNDLKNQPQQFDNECVSIYK